MTSLQYNVGGPPLMSVTPQGMGAHALPANLNSTVNDGYYLSRVRGPSAQNLLGSSRSHAGGNSQHESLSRRKKGTYQKSSATPQSQVNQAKQPQGARSPPPFNLMQAQMTNSTHRNEDHQSSSPLPAQNQNKCHFEEVPEVSKKPASRRFSDAASSNTRSSILTVTVLEAKLKIDTSGFLQTMQCYCQVSLQTLGQAPKPEQRPEQSSSQPPVLKTNPVVLESQNKKTQKIAGTEPKWAECFVFDLQSQHEYLLEVSVWSNNYLVSDSCLGRAFLKFNGSQSETGSITNWLALKSEAAGSDENGEIFVSISKEAILSSQTASVAQNDMYKHLVQSTEECAAVDGDPDDHQAVIQRAGNHQMLRNHEESEVHSTESDAVAIQSNYATVLQQKILAAQQNGSIDSDLDQQSLLGEDDEGIDSPVDDIALEEQEEAHKYKLLHEQIAAQQQQQQFYRHGASNAADATSAYDGELDDQLQAINPASQDYENGYMVDAAHAFGIKSGKTRNPTAQQRTQLDGGMVALGRHAQTFQQERKGNQHAIGGQYSLFQTSQPGLGLSPHAVQAQPHAYRTGGFSKYEIYDQNGRRVLEADTILPDQRHIVYDHNQPEYQQAAVEPLAYLLGGEDGDADDEIEGVSGQEDDCADDPTNDLEESAGGTGGYGDEDGEYDDQEDGEDSPHGVQTPIEDLENAAQMQLVGGLASNPSFLMHLQQQTAAEELADLQHDFVEENARLRQEGINNDKIHKKLEREAKQIKHEKSNLKKWQASLRSKSKRIKAQEEQLVYKKQQIEKESIKINKSMQKMRRIRLTLEQAVQLTSGLVSSEIFTKLRYEASLSQHQSVDGHQMPNESSDDWLLALQAQEFVNNMAKVKQLLEQVATDNALKGGATGSGDLNQKMTGSVPTNPATVQTTQHNQQNSQSSMQTQGGNLPYQNLARNQERKHGAGYSQNERGKTDQFLSENASITDQRSQMTNLGPSGNNPQRKAQNDHVNVGRLEKNDQNEQNKAMEAYWTNSSIQEIHAQHSNTFQIQAGASNALNGFENSTPHLAAGKDVPASFPAKMSHQIGRKDSNTSIMRNGGRNAANLHDRSAPTAKLHSHFEHKPQSTALSPHHKDKYQLPEHTQSRFHTEVEEDADRTILQNRPDTSISQNNQALMPQHQAQAAAAHEMYVRHLDVDLGDPDLISTHQNHKQHQQFFIDQAPYSQQRQQQPLQGTETDQDNSQILTCSQMDNSTSIAPQSILPPYGQQQILTGSSALTPEPLSQATPLQDSQNQAKPISQASQSSTNLNVSNTMAKQQEIYNELIGQVSKELQDIQVIKQSLVSMATQMNDQQTHLMQQMQPGAQQQNALFDYPDAINESAMQTQADQQSVGAGETGFEALKQQQMQFLLENQSQQQQQQNLEDDPEEDDDKGVEGYIWESMQRNAHRMQQFSPLISRHQNYENPTESSNQDFAQQPGVHGSSEMDVYRTENNTNGVGAEQINLAQDEILRNFQSQMQPDDVAQQQIVMGMGMEIGQQPNLNETIPQNQDEQKFTSSYIMDTTHQMVQQEMNASEVQATQNAQQVEDEDDELEFKFDPDFLNKINANMAMNDQVFEQRQEQQQQPIYQRTAASQNGIGLNSQQQQQQQQQSNLLQQSTLQGEQAHKGNSADMRDVGHQFEQVNPAQDDDDDEHHERTSFISTEQVTIVEDSTLPHHTACHPPAHDESSNANDASASFIMEYSHNQDLLRNSQIEEQHRGVVVSGRASLVASVGQNGAQGRGDAANSTPQLSRIPQEQSSLNDQNYAYSSNVSAEAPNSALKSGLADYHQNEEKKFNFGSPEATRVANANDNGSVEQAAAATLTNTVQKLRNEQADILTDGHNSVIRATAAVEVQNVDVIGAGQGLLREEAQMTANDFEISNRSSVRGFNDPEDDISRMINESYLEQSNSQNASVIYKDDKVFDQPKRALYGIQPAKQEEQQQKQQTSAAATQK